jgi:endonuclease YncB( thermonuclease family)
VGSTVTIQAKTIDRYGRQVAEVFSGGRNINQALVGSGAAFVYWQYMAGCDRNTYARLEQQAKSQRLGVWGDPGLMPPWQYRACRRSKSCS